MSREIRMSEALGVTNFKPLFPWENMRAIFCHQKSTEFGALWGVGVKMQNFILSLLGVALRKNAAHLQNGTDPKKCLI